MYKRLSSKVVLLLILLLASVLILSACNSRSSGREKIPATAPAVEDSHSEESSLGIEFFDGLVWRI